MNVTTQNLPKETMNLNSVIAYLMERSMFATAHYLMDVKHSYLKDSRSERAVSTIDAELHVDVDFLRRHFTFGGKVAHSFRELECEVTTYMWAI